MANNAMIEEISYRVSIDVPAQKQLIRGLQEIRQTEDDLAKQFEKLGPIAQAGVRGIQTRLGSLDNAIEDNRESVEDLRKELLKLDDMVIEPKVNIPAVTQPVAQRGTFRDAAGGFGDAGSLLSAAGGLNSVGELGGILQELGQAGDVVQALGNLPEAFNDIKSSLGVGTGGLIGGLGAVGVAVTVAGVAFSALNTAMEEGERRAELLSDAILAALQAGTSEGIEDLRNQAKRDLEDQENLLRIQEEKLNGSVDAYGQALTNASTNASNWLNQAAANLGLGEAPEAIERDMRETTQAIQGDIDATRQKIADLTSDINVYTEILGDESTAVRDAQASAYELARTLAGDFFAAANDAAAAAEELATKQAESTEQTREFVDALNPTVFHASRDALDLFTRAAFNVGEAATLASDRFDGFVSDFATGFETGANNFLEQVEETREAAEKLAETTRNNLARSIKGLTENVAESATDISEARADIARLQAESTSRIAEIQADLIHQEAEIQREGQEQLRALQEDFQTDQRHSAEDHQQAIQAIQERYQLSMQSAIADRDAVAAAAAQQERKQSLREEDQQYKTEERRRREAFQRAQRDQLEAINRELTLAREGAAREIQIEQEKTALEVQQRQAALNIMLQQYATFMQQLAALAAQYSGNTTITPDNLIIPEVNYISPEEAKALLGLSDATNSNTKTYVGKTSAEDLTLFDRKSRLSGDAQKTATKAASGDGSITLNFTMEGLSTQQYKALSKQEALEVFGKVIDRVKKKRRR